MLDYRAGANFLQLQGSSRGQSLGIAFENQFAVDWLDYNVYVTRKRQLYVHSLQTPSRSKVVYTFSQSIRNLVIENNVSPYFIAWIANDINIVRVKKVRLVVSLQMCLIKLV